jgi:hypothetical protein
MSSPPHTVNHMEVTFYFEVWASKVYFSTLYTPLHTKPPDVDPESFIQQCNAIFSYEKSREKDFSHTWLPVPHRMNSWRHP